MKKVERIDKLFEALRVFLGILIAFLICIIIIVLISEENPASAVFNFVVGPFMSKHRLGQVLAKYSSYLLSGLCMCFIYSAGRFNMAGEGAIKHGGETYPVKKGQSVFLPAGLGDYALTGRMKLLRTRV